MNKMILLLMVLILPALSYAVTPQEMQIKRGAQLYDNWYALSGKAPGTTHPNYPASGKQAGAETWRCKSCHGWDYLGKTGSYASGDYATGIKGVNRVRNWSREGLTMLLGPRGRHDYRSQVGKQDVAALVLFLRKGTVPVGKAIAKKGELLGSAEKGAALYAAQCAGCHGEQGTKIDLQPAAEATQGVGSLVRANPQRALHRIQWGVPGGSMPSMRADAGLTFGQVVDLLSFGQTLP